MQIPRHYYLYTALLCLSAATTYGQLINGYSPNPRVFNDNPSSTLSISPAAINSNPATFSIRDAYSGPFSGANRTDVLASSDAGATAHIFNIDDSFVFTTHLTLTAGSNSPRKEAGIRINSPITGDALFIVNSDAGEIVAFGGGAAFHLFGNNSGGNGYTPGTTILLGIREIGGGDGVGGTPNTLEYFIDRGAGIESSGPLPWSNLELGPLNFQVGVYEQGGANTTGDFTSVTFANTTFTIIPEPGTVTLLGMAMLGLVALHRKH